MNSYTFPVNQMMSVDDTAFKEWLNGLLETDIENRRQDERRLADLEHRCGVDDRE